MADDIMPLVDAEAQKLKRKQESNKAKKARYRAKHAEREKALRRAWSAANPEKVKAHRAAYRTKHPEEQIARCAAWRANNPEKVKASSKRYYAENSEREKAEWAAYRAANPERVRATLAAWRAENEEREKATAAAWRANNPDKVRAANRNWWARSRNAEGSHTTKDIQRIYQAQNGKCAYCKTKVGDRYHVDHIHPLSKGGSNWPSNLQITCGPCNSGKRDRDPIEHAQRLGFLL